jgi:hypothetical protein
MAWHKATEKKQFEILDKLCDRAKKLQLNQRSCFCQKTHMGKQAAERGQIEILTKQWDWAKILQVKPEGLRNEVVVSTDKYEKTTWYKAAECDQGENLENPCYLDNELLLET